jgi:hypothetical protein
MASSRDGSTPGRSAKTSAEPHAQDGNNAAT